MPKGSLSQSRWHRGDTYLASELYTFYSHLLDRHQAGDFPGGLVVSNSYAHYQCIPPTFDVRHPFAHVIQEAVKRGVVFVFAAGNNHASLCCGNPQAAASPNTIWSVNSLDEVITVGTVDWNLTNQGPTVHSNSSRGPGQWSTSPKPDVVAPTYGKVAWGNDFREMEWWGTSGACPQVAGLAALILSLHPTWTPDQIKQQIVKTATPLAGPRECVGAGMIDCNLGAV